MNTKLLTSISVAVIAIGGIGGVLLSPTLFRSANSAPVVAATIFPIADIAEHVVGDERNVVLIVPPGASPHSYSLAPSQAVDLQRAQAVFAIGHGLDAAIVNSVQKTLEGDVRVTEVDDGIALREFSEHHDHDHDDGHGHEEEHGEENEHQHEEGNLDPHYWLTVANAKLIAQTIRDTMQAIDPEHAQQYADNTQEYLAELDALEAELRDIASTATKREFIAVHDAWGYLADAYGFELIGTFEPVEGREPSPVDIQELSELIEEHGIATFYTEPQKQTAAAARLFEEEFSLNVEVLDPVGGVRGRNSYVDLMRYNISRISQ